MAKLNERKEKDGKKSKGKRGGPLKPGQARKSTGMPPTKLPLIDNLDVELLAAEMGKKWRITRGKAIKSTGSAPRKLPSLVEKSRPGKKKKEIVPQANSSSGKVTKAKQREYVKKNKARKEKVKKKSGNGDDGEQGGNNNRKPRRCRPGTVALRDCPREGYKDTLAERKDLDYVPDVKIKDVDSSDRSTRREARVFFNCGDDLVPLSMDHVPDKENDSFALFELGIKQEGAKFREVDGVSFYETDFGVWIPIIIRYTHKNMRLSFIKNNNAKEFWKQNNGCSSTLALKARKVLALTRKPVALLLGSKDKDSAYGHCVVVILVPTPNGGIHAVIKDSMVLEYVVFKRLAADFIRDCDIRLVEIVAMVDKEESVDYTDCVKEGYKAIGDVLDGNFIWNFNVAPFQLFFDSYSYGAAAPPQFIEYFTGQEEVVDDDGNLVLKSTFLKKDYYYY